MQKKTIRILSFALLIILAVSGCSSQENTGSKASAEPPIPTYLPMVENTVGLPPADESTARITLPAGFTIRIFAQGLNVPRLMATGPDGTVYVALRGSGQIARLPDRDRNGLADGVEIAADGLIEPHNLELHNGWMYVAETGQVSRLADENKDGFYEKHVLVTSNIPGSGGHTSRTLHFGPDGKLYVSAGSSQNIIAESDPRRAAILRFNPDGSIPPDNPFANDSDPRRQAVWAYGLRNSVDFLWSADGVLWADHNGSDGLGDNIPPEEIIIPVQKGKSHGWPYCYTPTLGLNQPPQPEVADTRMTPPQGFTCDQVVPALLTIPAHSAPLGMTKATTAGFPKAFQDDIFVAVHGSWNTTSASFRDCKIERVIVENGKVTGSETFANGWRAPGKPCGDGATWGRPAGVIIGGDGALYVSDDKSGRVYRITYTGG